MKNQETTLDEILNSELLNDMIEQEDKDLAEAGWTRKEVEEFAKSIVGK